MDVGYKAGVWVDIGSVDSPRRPCVVQLVQDLFPSIITHLIYSLGRLLILTLMAHLPWREMHLFFLDIFW